jgi:endonuclease YncB( thermonuclease family)
MLGSLAPAKERSASLTTAAGALTAAPASWGRGRSASWTTGMTNRMLLMTGGAPLACAMCRISAAMAIVAIAISMTWPGWAETITARVQPMDGDTFELAGVVIRLAEVDAPEISQKCEGGPKELRSCGVFVADVLAERISGQTVECEVHGIDEYDRRLASCSHAGEDLSTWLVSEGLALAFRRFSERLIPEEEAAKAAGRGLWQTTFEAPWDYRARRWEVAVQESPEGCPIKGNISWEGEKIYHTPWGSQWYERTKITVSEGERWFCDEAEALAAGWRAPLR